ncbi:DUF3891 family protein [bacterium]|nr:DUF3891 family protein [bacterium]
MIVRTLGDFHYLVPQAEHARQSAVIVAALESRWLGGSDRQVGVLRASRHHDDGWRLWDEAPRVREDGLPLPFDGIALEDHDAIWRRSIFGALDSLGPAEAAYIGRHSIALHKGSEEDELARFELVMALGRRSWRDCEDDEIRRRIEQGFSALFFGDAVSLIGVAGWSERLPFELRSEDGGRLTVEAWRDGDWQVRVAPWPFAVPALPQVSVDAVAIAVGEEPSAAARVRHHAGFRVRLPIDILPGEDS